MKNSAAHYLFSCLSILGAIVATILYWGLVNRDHFAALESNHSSTWYQDLGGDAITEIQDQDLYFHNIGASIDNLRRADIVIVGSSIVAFAVDAEIANQVVTEKYGLQFYNLSFVGVSSGEFTRRIVRKYNIHPKLWIINADDGGGGGNFFSENIQRFFGGDAKIIAATEHSRLTAFKEVARRNLRWRTEGAFKAAFASKGLERADRVPIPMFYRNAATGETDMAAFGRFDATDNPPVAISRNQDCHTTDIVIKTARDYIRDLGGEVVLTIIPNMHYCEQQAREVANALGVELVLPGSLTYSSWDNGGHLDRRGRLAFTRDFLAALEKSSTFTRIKQHKIDN